MISSGTLLKNIFKKLMTLKTHTHKNKMGSYYSKEPSEELVNRVIQKNNSIFTNLTDSLNKQIESDNDPNHVVFNKFLQNDYYLSVIVYNKGYLTIKDIVEGPKVNLDNVIGMLPSIDDYIEIGIDVPSFLRQCDINTNTGMMLHNKHTQDIVKWILLNEYKDYWFFVKQGLEEADIFTMDQCNRYYQFVRVPIILNKSIGRCRLVKKIFTK